MSTDKKRAHKNNKIINTKYHAIDSVPYGPQLAVCVIIVMISLFEAGDDDNDGDNDDDEEEDWIWRGGGGGLEERGSYNSYRWTGLVGN